MNPAPQDAYLGPSQGAPPPGRRGGESLPCPSAPSYPAGGSLRPSPPAEKLLFGFYFQVFWTGTRTVKVSARPGGAEPGGGRDGAGGRAPHCPHPLLPLASLSFPSASHRRELRRQQALAQALGHQEGGRRAPSPRGGCVLLPGGGCGEAATAASPAPACFLPGSVATPGPAVCFLPPNHGRPGLGERGINILAALHSSSLISQLSSSSARPRSCEVPGIQ